MATGGDATSTVTKISISGAALAALLQRCVIATGDCDGLLFGCASHVPAPPPSLSDYDDHAPSPSSPTLTISIYGHSSVAHPSSLCDPLGRFQLSAPGPAPIGFFSSRRRTALRPSMRELSLAHSLSKSLALTHPILFLLVSPSSSANLSTHSYDHRAFLLISSRLVPASLDVANVGPGFRDQYHSFAPGSTMPWLPLPHPSPSTAGDTRTTGEQNAVDGMVDGFGLGKLEEVVGSAAGHSAEMEDMYAGMLRRLEKLAKEVEKSNLRVLKQENRNLLLRFRYAGLE
ncbi:hypothetical protein ABZP36_002623 [Zizania latifolia]